MAAFATATDLSKRWKGYHSDDEALATQLLADASLWIRAWVPDAAAYAGKQDVADALEMVACSMVKRAMTNEDADGLESRSETVGPYTEQVAFRNPDGNLYLTKGEQALLDGLCGGNTAGAVSMSGGGL
ncbi:hypothetical protein GS907_24570 [Rhodococcus hoagii]|nr:hypothetical protein [Prescottella equi]